MWEVEYISLCMLLDMGKKYNVNASYAVNLLSTVSISLKCSELSFALMDALALR